MRIDVKINNNAFQQTFTQDHLAFGKFAVEKIVPPEDFIGQALFDRDDVEPYALFALEFFDLRDTDVERRLNGCFFVFPYGLSNSRAKEFQNLYLSIGCFLTKGIGVKQIRNLTGGVAQADTGKIVADTV